MERVKKIAKYTLNILGAISMLIVGINAIDGITIPYAIQIPALQPHRSFQEYLLFPALNSLW